MGVVVPMQTSVTGVLVHQGQSPGSEYYLHTYAFQG